MVVLVGVQPLVVFPLRPLQTKALVMFLQGAPYTFWSFVQDHIDLVMWLLTTD